MKSLTLQEVVTALEGMIDRPMPNGSVSRVCIDSRQVGPGDLFVAVRGERFDGQDYVGWAFAAGALAAVVREDFVLSPAEIEVLGSVGEIEPILIRVDDPVQAMGRLARYYRRSAIDGSVTVVAVTGSNGKTTTKCMIAHLLSGRLKGRASAKSFNNEIGVPLTLLETEPSEEFVICEVGTNAPGEIAALARLIEPEVAVITGIAEVHLEGLGSLEGIATEKLSLLGELRPDGCAVVNVDPELLRWSLEHDREFARLKKVTFGQCPEADLRLTDVRSAAPAEGSDAVWAQEFTVNDRFVYRLNVPGRHNVLNALAAIAVARRFGMDHDEIAARLASFELPPMRLQSQRVGRFTLINDAYNANPRSVAAAVDVLTGAPGDGRRVLVLGTMFELGEESRRLHMELAERIGAANVDLVVTVGEYAKAMAKTVRAVSRRRIETHAYASTPLAKRRLVSYLKATDTVLIKGSRGMALEHLVEVAIRWAKRTQGLDRAEAGERCCRKASA